MSDLIRRSDAIEALGEEPYVWTDDDEFAQGERIQWIYDVSAIKAVPSADRPQGEWIEDYNGNGWNDYWDYTCSNCGKRYERADAVLCKANFCPNCGARMKGADDE